MTPLAEGRQVVKRFGEVTAVDRVSLEVLPGQVVGLLGANGAGKTTFLRMLLGLIEPNGGRVGLFGGPPTRQSLRRVGYMPQGLGLYTDLTVAENLAFRARLFGVEVPELSDGLEDTAATTVDRLPLGLQRRIAFVAALLHHPDLLVLDEPTSGVDPLARARLWDTIRLAADQGAGVLVTTHHINEAEQCDHLHLLAAGRTVAEGSVEEIIGDLSAVEIRTRGWQRALALLEQTGLLVALAGTSLRVPEGDPDRIQRLLAASGIQADVSQHPATLEETFVSLAGR
ncbi:MAG: ABC transporter ATP-binding protein [Acidimicrobiia bacterium]